MRETLLIVDDNDSVRELVCAYVQQAGYRVIEAASSAHALNKARVCESIDIVLADVVLPDGSGFELVRSLERIYPSLRALYMSGYADAHLANSFIAKPFTASALRDALRLLLDRTRSETIVSPRPAVSAAGKTYQALVGPAACQTSPG
jgi:DNA-binding NtrC family response regulator